ncbi:MAG: helix-turn-helix transcriptional regulator, partial [Clostridiales bacterium]|nr:helix-turn-helix transcriptional regulator [Clostridiales bacterium]
IGQTSKRKKKCQRLLDTYENDIFFDNRGNLCHNQNSIYQMIQDFQSNKNYYQKIYVDFFPILAPDTLASELTSMFDRLTNDLRFSRPAIFFFIEGTIAMLFSVLSDKQKYITRFVNLESNKEEYIFSQIQKLMEKSNGRISRKELSDQLNYDDHYLNRIVNRQTGMSIKEYGQMFLLREASQLLLQTNQNITEIINHLGLSNRTYFYKIFQNRYGVTPKEFRDNARQPEDRFSIPHL